MSSNDDDTEHPSLDSDYDQHINTIFYAFFNETNVVEKLEKEIEELKKIPNTPNITLVREVEITTNKLNKIREEIVKYGIKLQEFIEKEKKNDIFINGTHFTKKNGIDGFNYLKSKIEDLMDWLKIKKGIFIYLDAETKERLENVLSSMENTITLYGKRFGGKKGKRKTKSTKKNRVRKSKKYLKKRN